MFRYVSGVSWARLQSGHHAGPLSNDLCANRAWTCQTTAKGLLRSSDNPGAVEEHGAQPWGGVERSALPKREQLQTESPTEPKNPVSVQGALGSGHSTAVAGSPSGLLTSQLFP